MVPIYYVNIKKKHSFFTNAVYRPSNIEQIVSYHFMGKINFI